MRCEEVETKELPELDDDFAQDVSEFDTLAEYREDVKKNLTEKKEKEARAAKEKCSSRIKQLRTLRWKFRTLCSTHRFVR